MTGSDDQTTEARNSILSGAAAALAGQLVVYSIGFAMSILLARALGPAGRGEYYLAVTAATVCLAVANLGVESANVVMLAQRRCSLEQLARNSGALAVLIGPIAAAATFGIYEATRSTVFEAVRVRDFAIVMATIPFSLHQLWLMNVFLLAKRLGRTQVALVTGAVLQLAGALTLLVLAKLDVTAVLLLYAASIAVPWAVLLAWSTDVAPIRPSVDIDVMRNVLGFALRFHPGLLLLFLLLRFDVFLVSAYRGPRDVGLYSLAILFAELTWLLTNPLVQAVIPFQAERSARESAPLAFKAARFNFALAGALCIVFASTLWFGLPLIYGEDFRGAYPAIVALLPGVWLMAGARPLTILVARQERPLLYTGLVFAGFALNVVLNLALIPIMGIVGASLASTAGYALLAIGLALWALRAGGLSASEALMVQPDDLRTVRELARRLRRTPMPTG